MGNRGCTMELELAGDSGSEAGHSDQPGSEASRSTSSDAAQEASGAAGFQLPRAPEWLEEAGVRQAERAALSSELVESQDCVEQMQLESWALHERGRVVRAAAEATGHSLRQSEAEVWRLSAERDHLLSERAQLEAEVSFLRQPSHFVEFNRSEKALLARLAACNHAARRLEEAEEAEEAGGGANAGMPAEERAAQERAADERRGASRQLDARCRLLQQDVGRLEQRLAEVQRVQARLRERAEEIEAGRPRREGKRPSRAGNALRSPRC